MNMINPHDPQPALSHNPSPADIAHYNAWADRNGRPRFGAMAAPAPAPAPAAPAGVHASTLQVRTAVQNGGRARWNPLAMRWELPLDGHVVVLTDPNGERTDAGDACRRIGRRLGVANFELIAW